ncbi:MAG: hypothetical protein AAB359_02590, partial [Elusimicrobiota bacterium]
TSPLIGWAVVGARQEGSKRLVAEVAGVHARIDENFFLCGREGRFLGYRRTNVATDDEHFRKEALAYRERRKQEARKRKP